MACFQRWWTRSIGLVPSMYRSQRNVGERGPRRPARLHPSLTTRSVAREVFVLQSVLVVLLVGAGVAAMPPQIRRDAMADARRRTRAAAGSFSRSTGLLAALNGPDPTATLRPLAEEARKASGVDAIIVYRQDGVILTHSNPGQIGRCAVGPYAEAATGRSFTKTRGTLGLSVISAMPVKDPSGAVVAIVSAPVTVDEVQLSVSQRMPVFLGSAVAALLLAAGGAWLVSPRLRRQTHGPGPAEMTRRYEHHDAVLHAVREGVLITDGAGRLLLANDEARRLLDLRVPRTCARRPDGGTPVRRRRHRRVAGPGAGRRRARRSRHRPQPVGR